MSGASVRCVRRFAQRIGKEKPMADLVATWYENSLTEQERKAITGRIGGAMEYGLTRSWNCLSEHVRMAVRREYRRITSKS
jgi:hypothetical protein